MNYKIQQQSEHLLQILILVKDVKISLKIIRTTVDSILIFGRKFYSFKTFFKYSKKTVFKNFACISFIFSLQHSLFFKRKMINL